MKYRLPGARLYNPRRKSELIDLIKPQWNGLMKELREMDSKQLRAILLQMRQNQFVNLMQKSPYEKIYDNPHTKIGETT